MNGREANLDCAFCAYCTGGPRTGDDLNGLGHRLRDGELGDDGWGGEDVVKGEETAGRYENGLALAALVLGETTVNIVMDVA